MTKHSNNQSVCKNSNQGLAQLGLVLGWWLGCLYRMMGLGKMPVPQETTETVTGFMYCMYCVHRHRNNS